MVLSDISIRRPVLAIVLNLVIVLIGIISYQRLAVRQLPNVDVPVVTVATSYPGANAQVIESQITKPIEDALSGIEGIDFIQSVSRAESSQVTVRFKLDRDADAQLAKRSGADTWLVKPLNALTLRRTAQSLVAGELESAL